MVDKTKTIDMSGNDIICRNILTASPIAGGTGFKQLWGNGTAPTSNTSTSFTITAAILLGGVLINNSAGATATMDTAANIVAAVNGATAGAVIGDMIAIEISANTGTTTVAAGTGGTFDTNVTAGAKVIAVASAKTVFVRLTNVTAGTEAYVIYM